MREVFTNNGTSFKTYAREIPDWIEIRHSEDDTMERYRAYDISRDPHRIIGEFRFTRGPEYIHSQGLGVCTDYQRRGVASALLERFRVDNPDAQLEIWATTEAGASFVRYALEREPECRAGISPDYVERSVGY